MCRTDRWVIKVGSGNDGKRSSIMRDADGR